METGKIGVIEEERASRRLLQYHFVLCAKSGRIKKLSFQCIAALLGDNMKKTTSSTGIPLYNRAIDNLRTKATEYLNRNG